jgi:hypothetical protein
MRLDEKNEFGTDRKVMLLYRFNREMSLNGAQWKNLIYVLLGYGLFQVDIPFLFHLGNLFLYSYVLKRHKGKI